jgi:hypothetical protein
MKPNMVATVTVPLPCRGKICPKDVLTNLTRGSVLEACPADLTAREETEKREVVGLNPLLGAAKVSLLICKLGADSRYGLVDMD